MTSVSATPSVASSSASSSSSSSAAASTAAATNALSYNDFLTMLLAEMKNQDPTQPMDPTAMVTQLATISQVGQAVQTNTTLTSLLSSSQLDPGGDRGRQHHFRTGRDDEHDDGFRPSHLRLRHLARRDGDAEQRRYRDDRRRRDGAMNEADALDVIQSALWMVIVGAGPAIGAAMVVGVAIALLQALTQVQEMTLTFVPKIVTIFLVVTPDRIVHRRAILPLHRKHLRANRARLRAVIRRSSVRARPKRRAGETHASFAGHGRRRSVGESPECR